MRKVGGQKGAPASTNLHHPLTPGHLWAPSCPWARLSPGSSRCPRTRLISRCPISLPPAPSPPPGVPGPHLHLGRAFTSLKDARGQQPRRGAALGTLSFGHDPRATPPETGTPGCSSAPPAFALPGFPSWPPPPPPPQSRRTSTPGRQAREAHIPGTRPPRAS